MIRFTKEYRINPGYRDDFEGAYSATGEFGRMFGGCMSYTLYRHKQDLSRFVLSHTWSDPDTFRRHQEEQAQNSYGLQQKLRPYYEKVIDLGSAQVDSSEYAIISQR